MRKYTIKGPWLLSKDILRDKLYLDYQIVAMNPYLSTREKGSPSLNNLLGNAMFNC